MSMLVGSATVSADVNGNITISGTGLALAQARQPTITPAQILAFKTAINNPTNFQNALNAIYVNTSNQDAALVTYITTNASVPGPSFPSGVT